MSEIAEQAIHRFIVQADHVAGEWLAQNRNSADVWKACIKILHSTQNNSGILLFASQVVRFKVELNWQFLSESEQFSYGEILYSLTTKYAEGPPQVLTQLAISVALYSLRNQSGPTWFQTLLDRINAYPSARLELFTVMAEEILDEEMKRRVSQEQRSHLKQKLLSLRDEAHTLMLQGVNQSKGRLEEQSRIARCWCAWIQLGLYDSWPAERVPEDRLFISVMSMLQEPSSVEPVCEALLELAVRNQAVLVCLFSVFLPIGVSLSQQQSEGQRATWSDHSVVLATAMLDLALLCPQMLLDASAGASAYLHSLVSVVSFPGLDWRVAEASLPLWSSLLPVRPGPHSGASNDLELLPKVIMASLLNRAQLDGGGGPSPHAGPAFVPDGWSEFREQLVETLQDLSVTLSPAPSLHLLLSLLPAPPAVTVDWVGQHWMRLEVTLFALHALASQFCPVEPLLEAESAAEASSLSPELHHIIHSLLSLSFTAVPLLSALPAALVCDSLYCALASLAPVVALRRDLHSAAIRAVLDAVSSRQQQLPFPRSSSPALALRSLLLAPGGMDVAAADPSLCQAMLKLNQELPQLSLTPAEEADLVHSLLHLAMAAPALFSQPADGPGAQHWPLSVVRPHVDQVQVSFKAAAAAAAAEAVASPSSTGGSGEGSSLSHHSLLESLNTSLLRVSYVCETLHTATDCAPAAVSGELEAVSETAAHWVLLSLWPTVLRPLLLSWPTSAQQQGRDKASLQQLQSTLCLLLRHAVPAAGCLGGAALSEITACLVSCLLAHLLPCHAIALHALLPHAPSSASLQTASLLLGLFHRLHPDSSPACSVIRDVFSSPASCVSGQDLAHPLLSLVSLLLRCLRDSRGAENCSLLDVSGVEMLLPLFLHCAAVACQVPVRSVSQAALNVMIGMLELAAGDVAATDAGPAAAPVGSVGASDAAMRFCLAAGPTFTSALLMALLSPMAHPKVGKVCAALSGLAALCWAGQGAQQQWMDHCLVSAFSSLPLPPAVLPPSQVEKLVRQWGAAMARAAVETTTVAGGKREGGRPGEGSRSLKRLVHEFSSAFKFVDVS